MDQAGGPEPLSPRLQENRTRLLARLQPMADVACRDLLLPQAGRRPQRGLLLHLPEMVDSHRLEDAILRPLLAHGADLLGQGEAGEVRLPVEGVASCACLQQVVAGLLEGRAVLLVEGRSRAWLLDVRRPPDRPVEDVQVEVSVHGSREAYTGGLQTNLGLLRRRLTTEALRLERLEIGRLTRTAVVLAHVDGKAPPALVEVVRQRLERLDPEMVGDSEELIDALSDRPGSLLPTVLVTERPDLTVRLLAAGRVAVLADNSPRTLLLPGLLMDHLMASDDFYEKRPFVFLVRLARLVALLVSVFLPALYVTVITFHLQAMPTLLTMSLLAQREGAPLPTAVEAFIMVLTFEILREAGLRLPRPVGPGVSIVGGLVIGEAAMKAGITSPAMVLVVSATAVSTFAIPSPTLANVATVFRLAVLLISSVFGFLGLMVGYLVLLAHLAGLTSARVPYASPAMPLLPRYLLDALGIRPRLPLGQGPTPHPGLASPPGDGKGRRR